ncbi:MAG: rhomboid family intramembrane serine protease [Prolixibacteraceae bacterium]
MSLVIVLITIAVSVYAFYNQELVERLSMKPYLVYHRLQLQRLLSHSLVHADWSHLLVNMYVLYVFGGVCEDYFGMVFGSKGSFYFVQLYVLSLIFSSAWSVFKYKNDTHYSAIGASGAVMAVVFTSIFFDPWNKLWFFGVIPIPGVLFGVLYLGYSLYMSKRNSDNIGHDAHFIGAIFGLIYPVIIEPSLLQHFLNKLFGH